MPRSVVASSPERKPLLPTLSSTSAPAIKRSAIHADLPEGHPLQRIIRDTKPKTLTELAALSGRQVPNLSHTLRMMEGNGLVELKRNVREIEPITLATEFLVVLG